LRNHDLKPYERIGEYGDVGVMVGHLTVPGLTEDQPASISPAAYKLLRDDYSFNGPVVTDDLGAMKAISDRHSLPDAVLLALKAGADQALWSSGGNVAPVLDRLEKAVRDGELSQERVDTSLTRVLRAKDACGAGPSGAETAGSELRGGQLADQRVQVRPRGLGGAPGAAPERGVRQRRARDSAGGSSLPSAARSNRWAWVPHGTVAVAASAGRGTSAVSSSTTA